MKNLVRKYMNVYMSEVVMSSRYDTDYNVWSTKRVVGASILAFVLMCLAMLVAFLLLMLIIASKGILLLIGLIIGGASYGISRVIKAIIEEDKDV
jgi:hypothetical protein